MRFYYKLTRLFLTTALLIVSIPTAVAALPGYNKAQRDAHAKKFGP